MHNEETILEDIARLESKLKAVRRKGNLDVESQICNRLGKLYELIGEWHEAFMFHHFDNEIAIALNDLEGQLIALNNIGTLYHRIGIFSKAKASFKAMLQVSDKAPKFSQHKCQNGVLDACNDLVKLYLDRLQSEPKLLREELVKKAFSYCEKGSLAAKKYKQLLDDGLLSKSETNLQLQLELEIKSLLGFGRFFGSTGRVKDACSFFDRAIQLCQHLSYKELFMFQLYEAKGFALSEAQEWSSAIEDCFDLQLKIATEEIEDDDLVADAQYNLANACYYLGDYNLAKSTILTCIDTIKVRSMDQTKSKKAESLLKRIFEAQECSDEFDRLDDLLKTCADGESKLDYMYQIGRVLQRLERFREAFEMARRMTPILERVTLGKSVKRKIYKLVAQLASQVKNWNDGMFYYRKWLDLINEEENESIIECLSGLLNCHIEGIVIDESLCLLASKFNEIAKQNDNTQGYFELQSLSHLSLIHDNLGNVEEAERFRNECLGLALVRQEKIEEELLKEYEDIENNSYFADRKTSKAIRSLMGGDFQMRTKTNKTGAIANRRAKAVNKNTEGPTKKVATRVRKPIEHERYSSASDLEDFIAPVTSSDENDDEENKETYYRKPKKKQKIQAVTLISSSSEDSDEIGESLACMSISNSQRQLIEDPYDFGPADWDPILTTNPAEDVAYRPSAIRIRVQVGDHLLIVPCFEDDITERKRISWLIKEASRRYAEIDEREPVIKALSCLNNEALLSPNDPVSLVLSDAQIVKAHIDGWKRRAWLQEYQYQCQRIGSTVDSDIANFFENLSLDSNLLDFSFLDLSKDEAWISTIKAKSADYPMGFQLYFSNNISLPFGKLELSDIPLEAFNLTFYSMHQSDQIPLISIIRNNLRCLKSIELSYLIGDFGEFISQFMSMIGEVGIDSSVKELKLCGLNLSELTSVNFEQLHYLPTLENLSFEASILSRDKVLSIQSFLSKSSSIKRLTIQTEFFEELLLGIEKNHSLCFLDLFGEEGNLGERLVQINKSRINPVQLHT